MHLKIYAQRLKNFLEKTVRAFLVTALKIIAISLQKTRNN